MFSGNMMLPSEHNLRQIVTMQAKFLTGSLDAYREMHPCLISSSLWHEYLEVKGGRCC